MAMGDFIKSIFRSDYTMSGILFYRNIQKAEELFCHTIYYFVDNSEGLVLFSVEHSVKE